MEFQQKGTKQSMAQSIKTSQRDTKIYQGTILTHNYKMLRKKYLLKGSTIKVINYPNAANFRSESIAFKNIIEFWDIFQEISKKPHNMLIRGINSAPNNNKIRRTTKNFPEPEHGTNWFQIDVDKYTNLPDTITPCSEAAIKYFIIHELPREFHTVSYIFQYSNSAGILNPDGTTFKDGLNVHLYFYTDRSVTNSELKSWVPTLEIDKNNVVDHRLFSPVQPHYTALPHIGNGITCALDKRQGLVIKKCDYITVPPITTDMNSSCKYIPSKHASKTQLIHNHKLIEKLIKVGCIFEEHENSVNIWHSGEKSRGGYYVYFDDPTKVYHPNHQKMTLNKWLKTYWNYQIEPYYNTEKLLPEAAQEKLYEIITAFRDNPQPTIIKASAGLGKSEAAYKILLQSDKKVYFLVKTQKLAEEQYQKIQKEYPHKIGIVIKGRNQEGMCILANRINSNGKDMLQKLSERGVSIYSSFCQKKDKKGNVLHECEIFSTCPYLKQFKDALDCDYVFLTHNALINPEVEGLELPNPDYLVVDESFWQIFTHTKRIFQEINDYINMDCCKDFSKEVIQILKLIKKAANNDVPFLKYLRNNGVTKNQMIISKEISLANIKHNSAISFEVDEQDMEEICKEKYLHIIIHQLMKCLVIEYDRERIAPHSLSIQDGEFYIHYRKDLLRFTDPTIPILILDADADNSIISKVLPHKFNFHEIDVIRKSKIYQLSSTTIATNTLCQWNNDPKHNREADSIIHKIQNLIDKESTELRKVLVICAKDVEDKFHIPSHCNIEHFNNIRGLDKYKDYDTNIVIGRIEPSIVALENLARALHYDDENELQFIQDNTFFPLEERGYTSNNFNDSVEVSYHPDSRIDTILKQIRECETIQSASRIRDIWNTGKKVYLLCKIPVDMEIDSLINWNVVIGKVSKLQQVVDAVDWHNCVLPLTPTYCVNKFPHIWTNNDAFTNWIHKSEDSKYLQKSKDCKNPYIIYNKESTILDILEYTTYNQTSWSKTLTLYGVEVTKLKLEEQLGIKIQKMRLFSNEK